MVSLGLCWWGRSRKGRCGRLHIWDMFRLRFSVETVDHLMCQGRRLAPGGYFCLMSIRFCFGCDAGFKESNGVQLCVCVCVCVSWQVEWARASEARSVLFSGFGWMKLSSLKELSAVKDDEVLWVVVFELRLRKGSNVVDRRRKKLEPRKRVFVFVCVFGAFVRVFYYNKQTGCSL